MDAFRRRRGDGGGTRSHARRTPATANAHRRLYHHRRRHLTSSQPSLRPSVQARSLVLDSKAIDNLELFANSSDHGADGTLFKVLDKTASPFGKRLLRRWVCAPLRAVDEISERQVTRRCYCHRHTLRHHHRHLHLTTQPPYVRTRWAR